MKTQVKVYREEENELLVIDEAQESKYNELMSELGIEKAKSDSKKPSVYIPLNNFTHNCLRVLCPNSTEYKHYNKSTIPLEVLEIISYCEDNKIFDKLYIYSDTTEPDPVLIGATYTSEESRQKEYSWNMNYQLIARWGDCAYELPELVEMAKQRVAKKLKSIMADVKGMMASFNEYPDGFIEKSIKDLQDPITRTSINN